jgi:hypothetical protein
MGHIKNFLSGEMIEHRSITPNMIWTDLCENVHLHYRNVRLEFSELEFATFRAAINMLGRAVEITALEHNYEEGDPNFLVQQMFNTPLSPDSDYYSNRVTLELQKDNTVHFHYRDLRLHWSFDEFKSIANLFIKAWAKIEASEREESIPRVKKAKTMNLPIDMIQPYDEGHRPLVIDKKHREGIDFIKEEIKKGVKIRPILINPTGQRLDGFKRYMAFKELGYDSIDCIVDPFGQMGGQTHQHYKADE